MNERVKQAGDRARELAKLRDTSSWSELERMIVELKEQYEKRILRRMLSGGVNAPPIDQRQVDYQRGFFAALDAILAAPDTAERALQQALRRQETHERL